MTGDAPLSVILAAASLVVALSVLFWGLAGLGRRKPSASVLEPGGRPVTDEHRVTLQQPARERFVRPMLSALARRARRLTPAGWVTNLERRVNLAGSTAKSTVDRILAVKLLLAITALIASVFWIGSFWTSGGSLPVTLGRLVLIPGLALAAYMLPDLALRLKGRERQQEIQIGLPDALDQMSISVEAGLGFDAALQRVVEAGRGPLVQELHHTMREISIGIPRKQAFHNLVERTDVPELRHFVFAVNQAEQYGLPISQVLRVQSKELRVIRRQRAEERAMKIPVKIVFPLVLCIFPAVFVVILVPAAIRIFEVLL